MHHMWNVPLFEPLTRKNKDMFLHIYTASWKRFFLIFFLLDLQESISRIHRTIELMYSDKTMVQVSTVSASNKRCFLSLLLKFLDAWKREQVYNYYIQWLEKFHWKIIGFASLLIMHSQMKELQYFTGDVRQI